MPDDIDKARRQEVWARIQARSHWIVALTESMWFLTEILLAAIDAQAVEGATVRVDCWEVRLVGVDHETGDQTSYGILRLLSWPRPG